MGVATRSVISKSIMSKQAAPSAAAPTRVVELAPPAPHQPDARDDAVAAAVNTLVERLRAGQAFADPARATELVATLNDCLCYSPPRRRRSSWTRL